MSEHPETPESAPELPEHVSPAIPKLPRPVPAWHLHRRLYDWVLHWADTRYGGWALFAMSFAESSFFPVPPDVLLAPLVLGNRRKWVQFAAACSIASIFGGILGYMIGMFLWASVGSLFHDHVPGFDRDEIVLKDGRVVEGVTDLDSVTVEGALKGATPVYPFKVATADGQTVEFFEAEVDEIKFHPFTKVRALYNLYNWQIVAVAGFTPLPYKVITITAGALNINFMMFLLASAVSRSARFFLVAGLMGRYGPAIKPYIDKYFNLLCFAFVALLIGGFVVLRYVG